MKIWSYPELAQKLPKLWKILERREDAHAKREKKKPPRKRRLGDPDASEARREITRLLLEVETENKCECCRAIEALQDRIESLEREGDR